MTGVPPGWYKDPADPTTQRYWDGDGWLGEPIPADATPPKGPPSVTSLPSGLGLAGLTGKAPSGATPGTARPQAEPPQTTPHDATLPEATPPEAGAPEAAPAAGVQPEAAPAASAQPDAAVPPVLGGPPSGGPPPSEPAPGEPTPTGPASNEPTPSGPAPAGPTPSGPVHGMPGQPAPRTPPWPNLPPAVTLRMLPPPRPHGHALAPYGYRLMARVIDILAVGLLSLLVNGWLMYQLILEVVPGLRAALENPTAQSGEPNPRVRNLMITILIIITALWFAYEVPALANTGQTFGKRLMHIKVVRVESTEPLGFGRAFRRWARLGMWTPLWWCAGIGLLFQLISVVSLLFDQPLRQALHDKVAGTVVVLAPPPTKKPADNSPAPADDRPAQVAGDNGSDRTGGSR